MANPLNAFVDSSPTTTTVRIAPFPKLQELVKQHGFMPGIEAFDQKMEEWKQNFERDFNQRIASKQPSEIPKSNT